MVYNVYKTYIVYSVYRLYSGGLLAVGTLSTQEPGPQKTNINNYLFMDIEGSPRTNGGKG
jgi:hypothetical protein